MNHFEKIEMVLHNLHMKYIGSGKTKFLPSLSVKSL